MPHILSKLTSCVHRKHLKPMLLSTPPKQFFKLSRFELMPDEILVEIFEYLSLIDLYNAFVNLNFRLNILLRDVRLGINLNQNEESRKYLFNALDYFCKQIVSIHIDRYPLLNLRSFPNLRSLIIYFPTKTQLLSINNQILPNLNRLWIGIINSNDENILYENLFLNNQLTKLNSFYLFQMNFNENLTSYQICFNIQQLFLTNIKTKDFLLILSLLPNLYRLEICISDVFSTSFKNLTNISHQNLRILKIEFLENVSQLNNFNSLISFVPYIQRCTLLLVNLIQIKDYASLQNILSQNLLQLKQFICSIDYYCQLSSNQMINKFQKLKMKLPFFQTMKIIPCDIHQDKCLRKTWMNKTLIPIC